MAKTYSEKLKDPRWQKLRLEVLQRDNWTCTSCGDTGASLHIHHFRYVIGREPWEYPSAELRTLCEHCHTDEHQMRPEEESVLLESLKCLCLTADDLHELAGIMLWSRNILTPVELLDAIRLGINDALVRRGHH